jgi:hypothetical protein
MDRKQLVVTSHYFDGAEADNGALRASQKERRIGKRQSQ